MIRNLDWSNIGERHARVLCLATSIPTGQVRVTKKACRRVTKHLLRHPRVGIRVLTEREHLLLAEKTPATGNRERNDDSIANRQIRHLATNFDDLAHKLVTKNVARHH